MAGKVYSAAGNGYGTPTISDAVFASSDNDIPAYRLDVGREIEVIAVAYEEVFWSGGRASSCCVGSCARGEVESLLQCFVALSQRLLRYVCQIAYFAESTRDMCLTASNEYAGSDDCVEGLATQQLFLVGPLIKLFGDVADSFWEGELVTPIRDVSECG